MPQIGEHPQPFINREELVAALACTKEKRARLVAAQEARIRALMEEAELENAFKKLLAPDLRGAVCMHGGSI